MPKRRAATEDADSTALHTVQAEAVIDGLSKRERTISGRGRNGWFDIKCADVFASSTTFPYVCIYSSRIGRNAPIAFTGDTLSMIEFFEDILRRLKEK